MVCVWANGAPYMHSALSGVVALHLLWQHVLKHASLPDHHLLFSAPHVGLCLQEYVTQLAMALLEQGRKPDNEAVIERIKRLVNEAVRACAAVLSAAAV